MYILIKLEVSNCTIFLDEVFIDGSNFTFCLFFHVLIIARPRKYILRISYYFEYYEILTYFKVLYMFYKWHARYTL